MKNMKKLVGFVFFGLVIASANSFAGDRKKGKRSLEEGSGGEASSKVLTKCEQRDESVAESKEDVIVSSSSSQEITQNRQKKAKTGIPTPATMLANVVKTEVQESGNSAEVWHAQRISRASIEAFLTSFATKQARLFEIMKARGFSPLAAAIFLGLDADNMMDLLGAIDYRNMLAAPAYVPNADAEEMPILGLAMELAPLLSGVIGRTPEEMAKWFVRRIAMSRICSKVSATHFAVMAGYTEGLFAGMPKVMASNLVAHVNENFAVTAESAGLTVQECALNSQSLAAATWAGVSEEDRAAMKMNTFYEDLMACPQAIMTQFMTAETGSAIGNVITNDANIAMVLAMLTPERMEAVLGMLTDERIAAISQTFEAVADNPKTTQVLEQVIAKMPAQLKKKLIAMAATNAVSSVKKAAWNAAGSFMTNAGSMFWGTGDDDDSHGNADDLV